jgi:hypothetical protein
MACLGVTGVMTTSPTGATEVFLGLPPSASAAGSRGQSRYLQPRLQQSMETHVRGFWTCIIRWYRDMLMINLCQVSWYTEALELGWGYGTSRTLSCSVGQYTTVFQAEVYDIKTCVAENLDRSYSNRQIHILWDSQAAVKAFSNHRITSKLVWDCHQSLIQLAEHNCVQLVWAPGFLGFVGN